jgi:hypothetical protein
MPLAERARAIGSTRVETGPLSVQPVAAGDCTILPFAVQ